MPFLSNAFPKWGRSVRTRTSSPGDQPRFRTHSRAQRLSLEPLESRITPTTFLVVNTLDGPGSGPAGSLRNAISQANLSGDAHDVVVITPRVKGTIALNSGELSIASSLTILNQSGRPIEILQNTTGQRVFEITASPLTTHVTLGATSARETLTITGGNLTTGNGGGILVDNPANVLTLAHVQLVGNSAGLASASSTSRNGGGIDSVGRVVLYQSSVGTASNPNQTSGDGGGVWAGAGVTLIGSTVSGNQAGTDAGGLDVTAGNAVIASGSTVSGNTALLGTAGGLNVVNGNTTVSQSRVNNNLALNAGGINEIKGNVQVLAGSQVNGNASTASLDVSTGNFGGGGICEGLGNVLVSASQVNFNHSVGMYSSGIVVGLGSVTVTNQSQVNGNRNNGPGGGIAANFGGVVTVSGGSQVNFNTGAGNGGGIVNFAGPLGGVKISGGSQVSHNTLTNFESLGQAVGVFLELLAGKLGLDVTSATGGTTLSALNAEIAQINQDVSPTASTSNPSGFVVSGGGIGTLLGASITVSGGSHVDDNLSGARVSSGNPNSIGIGGGIFSGLGSVRVTNSTVNGNIALGAGGGIWNMGTTTLVGSSLSHNTAFLSPGGGLENTTTGTVSITRSLIQGNSAGTGGGIFNGGTLRLTDSLITRNRASTQGGGLTNQGQLTLTLTRLIANTPDNILSLS